MIEAIPVSLLTSNLRHYVVEEGGPSGLNGTPVTEALHEHPKPVRPDLSAIKTELRLLNSIKTDKQRQTELAFDADSRSGMVGTPE